VVILLNKKIKENVECSSHHNSGRILRSTLKTNDSTFHISNINARIMAEKEISFLMQLIIHCLNIQTIRIKITD
jgi:hypothetical protein